MLYNEDFSIHHYAGLSQIGSHIKLQEGKERIFQLIASSLLAKYIYKEYKSFDAKQFTND